MVEPGTSVGPPPPFDAECSDALGAFTEVVKPGSGLDVYVGLRQSPARPPASDDELARGGRFRVDKLMVPGPLGSPDVHLLLCIPTWISAPRPGIYFIHGGGMIGGTDRSGFSEVLDWAEQVGAVAVSVTYRLAPEHPHPAPVEDCYAGLLWTAEHAAEAGIDSARIVVAGSSAGGGIAAAVTLLARDRGRPMVAGQLLCEPMIDDHNDSVSARQMAGLGVWDRTSNDAGWTALLGAARHGPDVSPYAAPARAQDLSRLPPTFIDVGSAETFRDEAVGFATRLWGAGQHAELHVWPGGFHGYADLAPAARLSRDTVTARIAWLRRLIA